MSSVLTVFRALTVSLSGLLDGRTEHLHHIKQWRKVMSKEYDEGYTAYQYSTSPFDNPYEKLNKIMSGKSKKHAEWAKGWYKAEDEELPTPEEWR